MNRKDRLPLKKVPEADRLVFLVTHERYQLFRVIARWFFGAVIVFLAVPLPVYLGAGQETVINLAYKAIIEGDIGENLTKFLIAALILLVFVQRWHFTGRLKHLGGRSEELERKIDPGRSSSHPKT